MNGDLEAFSLKTFWQGQPRLRGQTNIKHAFATVAIKMAMLAHVRAKMRRAAIQRHPRFPSGANVEFVQLVTRSRVRQRTLERGVGETDACGTGACATAVALAALGLADHPLEVELRGGVLTIAWEPGSPVLMTGPAVTVFSGHLPGVGRSLKRTLPPPVHGIVRPASGR